MWDDANHVQPEHLTVVMTYTFLKETKKKPPVLLGDEDGWTLSIGAVSANNEAVVGPSWKSWLPMPLLPKPEVFLTAGEQSAVPASATVRRWYTVGAAKFFSRFTGEMGRFADVTAWNGALVELHLRARPVRLAERLKKEYLEWEDDQGNVLERLKETYDMGAWLHDNENPTALIEVPCTVKAVVYLRNCPITTSTATLVQMLRIEEEIPFVVAKFPITRVADLFPRFTAPGNKAGTSQ